MESLTKRIYSIVLTLCLCLTLLPSVVMPVKAATVTFSDMLERAEAIINYKWVPNQRIYTWNGSTYKGKNYFEAGETVTGMPYTLFSWELSTDSLLSLSQFKNKTSTNYSTTKYCNSVEATRTGPVYGSCCATFVSEVFGGYYMNGSNPRFDSVYGFEHNNSYGITTYNVTAKNLKPGDALSNSTTSKNGTHIVWVGNVTDSTVTIYEQTPPITKKTVVSKSSVNSSGYLIHDGAVYSTVTRSIELGDTSVAPQKPTITEKSYYYKEGASATISWSAVSGNSFYWISIWKDGELIVNQTMDNKTSYTMSNLAKGEYKFSVSANNSAGNLGGTSFSFLVGKAPNKTEISTNQTSYTAGDSITASWTAEIGTTYYWINVYKDGELIVNKSMDTETSYTLENAEIGEYKIAVSANNGAGNSGGSSVSFSVSKIGAPIISSSKTNYKTNQTVEVSWESVAGASSYVYYLSEYPNEYAYTTNVSSGTVTSSKVTFHDLPNGRYTIFVCSVSEAGKRSSQSNWVTFYIYNSDYVPVKAIEHDGHIYALFDIEVSWDFAKKLCSEMGGHLATVTSEQENNYLTELISYGDKDAYWLGASNVVSGSYKTTGAPFKWITDEVFDYTNWKSGEPSQSGEKASLEHFLEVRKSYNNKWNDAANTNRKNKGFILEIDTTVYNPVAVSSYGNSKYLLFDESLPWIVAQTYCESIGGHLVTIMSEDEDKAVHALAEQGQKAWYFMGASKLNGEWAWVDDGAALSSSYSNWSNSSSWGNYLMKYKVSGDWIGINNFYSPGSNMELLGFVCEIDNAVFTVSYNANGGTAAPEAQIKYYNDTLVLSSVKPTRSGYTFLGWSTSSNVSSITYQPGDTFVSNVDTTLFAIWKEGCEGNNHKYVYNVCSICGHCKFAVGDVDGDESVTFHDAVYLLLYTMFGEEAYPLNGVSADMDGNGTVEQDDAVYLLLHTLFGEKFYPLRTPSTLSQK